MSDSMMMLEQSSTWDQTCVPISSLDPGLPNLDTTCVKATVAVLWPYSASNGTLKLLIAASDFRLRNARGQAQVQFSGSSARAIASAGIGSGDILTLSLAGVTWHKNVASSFQLPGHSIEWQLEYSRGVQLQIHTIDSQEVKMINVDDSEAIPDHPQRISTPDPLPSPPRTLESSYRSSVKHTLEPSEWSSPAFLKRARMSYGSLLGTEVDALTAEAGVGPGSGRKSAMFRRQSVNWRYNSVSRSPTPEAAKTTDQSPHKLDTPLMTDEACQTVDYDDPDARTTGIPSGALANKSKPSALVLSPEHSQLQKPLSMENENVVRDSAANSVPDTSQIGSAASTENREQAANVDDMPVAPDPGPQHVGMSGIAIHRPFFDSNASISVVPGSIDDQYGQWQGDIAKPDSLAALARSSLQGPDQQPYPRSLIELYGHTNSESSTPLIDQSSGTISAVLNSAESECLEYTGNVGHPADIRRHLPTEQTPPPDQGTTEFLTSQSHLIDGRHRVVSQNGDVAEESEDTRATFAGSDENNSGKILERKNVELRQIRNDYDACDDDEDEDDKFMEGDNHPEYDRFHEGGDNSLDYCDDRKDIGEDDPVELSKTSDEEDSQEEQTEEEDDVVELHIQEEEVGMGEGQETERGQGIEQGKRHGGWTVSRHDYSKHQLSGIVEDIDDEHEDMETEDEGSPVLFDDASLGYPHGIDEEDEEYMSQDFEVSSVSEHDSEASTDNRDDVPGNIGRPYNEPEVIDLLSDSESEPDRVTRQVSVSKEAFGTQISGHAGQAESPELLLEKVEHEMNSLSPHSEDEMDKGRKSSPADRISHQDTTICSTLDGSTDEHESSMLPLEYHPKNSEREWPITGLSQDPVDEASLNILDGNVLIITSTDDVAVCSGTESDVKSSLPLTNSDIRETFEHSETSTISNVFRPDDQHLLAGDIDPNLEDGDDLQEAEQKDLNVMHSPIGEIDPELGNDGRLRRADVEEVSRKDEVEYLPTPESTDARITRHDISSNKALLESMPGILTTDEGFLDSPLETRVSSTVDGSAEDVDDATASGPVPSSHTALSMSDTAGGLAPAMTFDDRDTRQINDVSDLQAKDEGAETAVTGDDDADHDIKDAERSFIDSRPRLRRSLQTNLGDFIVLKVLRFSLEKKVDVLAIATSRSSEPQKVKNGPKHWSTQLTIGDASTPHVVEVQVFRPHLEALPVIQAKDAVLLRHFTVKAGKGRQFALRSNDASSWVVFGNAGEVRTTGPPVEYGEGEANYLAELREWCEDPSSAIHEKFVQ